jgi:uncharacterized membrane protein
MLVTGSVASRRLELGGLEVLSGWTLGPEAWLTMGIWAFVLLAAVWLLLRDPHREPHDDPRVILQSRFARGEITEEELRRALAASSSEPATSGDEQRR